MGLWGLTLVHRNHFWIGWFDGPLYVPRLVVIEFGILCSSRTYGRFERGSNELFTSIPLNISDMCKEQKSIKKLYMEEWISPTSESLKFNIDGSTRGNLGLTGIGVLVSGGRLLASYSSSSASANSLHLPRHRSSSPSNSLRLLLRTRFVFSGADRLPLFHNFYLYVEKARVSEWTAHQNAIFDICWIKGDNSILTVSGDKLVKTILVRTNHIHHQVDIDLCDSRCYWISNWDDGVDDFHLMSINFCYRRSVSCFSPHFDLEPFFSCI
ncbi:hypothetical protein Ddye_024423 [Dipteronia dyeriana]|uniref:Uncharacterized protein n=1 Tax=Dipteronia dyeriana TaxID=168575 RepID=A0AAD9WUF4_9ROSI|nr:hypothetical protein Ddye_024423 [Dipteronia dyeriana]